MYHTSEYHQYVALQLMSLTLGPGQWDRTLESFLPTGITFLGKIIARASRQQSHPQSLRLIVFLHSMLVYQVALLVMTDVYRHPRLHLFNYLHTQILRPPWLVDAVRPRPYRIARLDFATREPQHRRYDLDILPNRLDVIAREEFGPEHPVAAVLPDHANHPGKSVRHVVIMAEDRRPVALPQLLPHVVRVHAAAVDEPLRVVVKSHVDGEGPAFFRAANERRDDSHYARDTGAVEVCLSEKRSLWEAGERGDDAYQ